MNLANYDWLFYLDSDALIMNDMIKLETLIDDDYDMIATMMMPFPPLYFQGNSSSKTANGLRNS